MVANLHPPRKGPLCPCHFCLSTCGDLRAIRLSGSDLPELYIKVRGKLLEYETERSPRLRELNEELADLGRRLGDNIDLDETKTCYFLLLGQALAVKMMPPTKTDNGV